MEILQNNGIPCGAVLNALGMLSDPNFRARGFFESVDHTAETGLGKREDGDRKSTRLNSSHG